MFSNNLSVGAMSAEGYQVTGFEDLILSLRTKATQLPQRFGPMHPRLQEIRSEMAWVAHASTNKIARDLALEDKKGNMRFGADGYGVFKSDGRSFTHFTKKDGLCNNVIGIMEDRHGTFGSGLSSLVYQKTPKMAA